MKTAEVYLEGELVRMVSMRVPVLTALGLYLVGSLKICVRLRASSLDCRMAGVLSIVWDENFRIFSGLPKPGFRHC